MFPKITIHLIYELQLKQEASSGIYFNELVNTVCIQHPPTHTPLALKKERKENNQLGPKPI